MEPQPLESAADAEPSRSIGALIALAGAGLVIAGSALPWVRQTGQEETIVTTGIAGGDGWISLVLAVILAALALRNRLNPEAGISGVLVVTALLGLMTAYEIIDIRSHQRVGLEVDLSIGYGLWLMASGVVLSTFGVIRMRAG